MTDEVRIAEVERKLERNVDRIQSDYEFYLPFLKKGMMNMKEFKEKLNDPGMAYNSKFYPPSDDVYAIWNQDDQARWDWTEVE